MDFGTNPAPATAAASRRAKQDESFGIATIELPNGQRLDGYVVLTAKNAAKLGISADQLKGLVDGKKKGSTSVTLHLQFGDREQTIAEPVAIAFA